MNSLRRACLLSLALLPLTAKAQDAPAAPLPPAPPAVASPDTPAASPAASLDISPTERAYFELGTTLARGTFAYAPLGSDTSRVERSHSRTKVAALARLAPDAAQAREMARLSFARALTLLHTLNAPDAVLSPVARLAAHLAKPLPLTADARAIQSLSPDAARVLSALSESQLISHVMEDRALTHWLNIPSEQRAGPVWYAEGFVTGVAEIAAARHLPELLPPVTDLATDLRGLRDWLALRVPDNPTPTLADLQTNIAAFLQGVSVMGARPAPITDAQLSLLGAISRGLQSQILLPVSQ